MVRWEYLQAWREPSVRHFVVRDPETYKWLDEAELADLRNARTLLNYFGDKGWECFALHDNAGVLNYFFKRPLKQLKSRG